MLLNLSASPTKLCQAEQITCSVAPHTAVPYRHRVPVKALARPAARDPDPDDSMFPRELSPGCHIRSGERRGRGFLPGGHRSRAASGGAMPAGRRELGAAGRRRPVRPRSQAASHRREEAAVAPAAPRLRQPRWRERPRSSWRVSPCLRTPPAGRDDDPPPPPPPRARPAPGQLASATAC